MSVEEDIIEQYITECTNAGITLPIAMRDKLLDRIKEIDVTLEQADRLRPEKQKALKILQGLGFEMPKAKRAAPIKENTTLQDLDEADKSIAINLCNYVEKNGPSTASTLMKACGKTVVDDHQIYRVIKWVCDNGYCIRNSENQVTQGPNWKNRPKSV